MQYECGEWLFVLYGTELFVKKKEWRMLQLLEISFLVETGSWLAAEMASPH
jgi:hypothetical protein